MYWIIEKNGEAKPILAKSNGSSGLYIDGKLVLSVLTSPYAEELTPKQSEVVERARAAVKNALEHSPTKTHGQCLGCGSIYSSTIAGFCDDCRPG